MKIAILVQDLVGQGMQYAMAAVARGLIARGVDVDVLISPVHTDKLKTAGCDESFALSEKVNLIFLPSRHARHNILAVRKYLKKTDAAAVLSTSGPYHKCLRLASVGLRRRPLTVLVNHGNFGWDSTTNCSRERPSRFSFAHLHDRWFHGGFDRELFVCEQARQNFLRIVDFYDSKKTATVYNPVVDELFLKKTREQPTHPWLINKECPTFVTAGAFCESKDHLMLMKAFREVVKNERARLIVYGKGPLESEYRRFIADNRLEDVISIGGFTNKLPAEMKAADGFLMSSKWESFGIVIVEAMACGLPVVSTDAPLGPREVLKDGKFGALVPVGDYRAMAKAVLDVVRGRGIQPPDESWKPYTLEAATDRYLAALRRELAQGGCGTGEIKDALGNG